MIRRMVVPAVGCVLLIGLVAWGLNPAEVEPAPARPAKAPAAKPATQPAKWTPLFNGKDLDGWTARGRAIFKVEDKCLVGTQTTGAGGDLATTAQWGNFELRVTYRVVWPANSGFWYRYDPKRGRGYQFDVLKWKRPVAFSGTLYCPGKMFIFSNLKEAVENRDGWNEARIWANGEVLIHWLNGTEIGRCRDKTFQKGHIGIQVHGGAFKGMKIIIKRMELRSLRPDEAPPKPKPATQPAPKPAK